MGGSEENFGAQFERLCERLLNSLAAQLRSWTRHRQDSEKNAKWTSKHRCSAFLYIFPFLLLCLSIVLSLSISERSLCSCSLYSFMSPGIFHPAFLMNSLLHIQFFVSAYFLSFYHLFCPLRLSHSAIADTLYFR